MLHLPLDDTFFFLSLSVCIQREILRQFQFLSSLILFEILVIHDES